MEEYRLNCNYEDIITKLKFIVRCPICLGSMRNVLQLNCGHRYCEECYLEYKLREQRIACALCKAPVVRRAAVYRDEYANILGKFLTHVGETLGRYLFPCDSDEDELENVTECQVDNTKKVCRDDDKKLASPLSQPSENAFDKLMGQTPNTHAFNKKETRRTYGNNSTRKPKARLELQCKILNFDDNKNKQAVVEWLNDTRNKFDRLTQTQNFILDDEEDNNVCVADDLPSVSQIRRKDTTAMQFSKITHTGRARSLNIEVKRLPNKLKKRNSAGSVFEVENYDIEEINSEEKVVEKAEENVLLNIIEDKFLNNLDNEFQTNDDLTSRKSVKSAKTPSPGSVTGWNRISEMQKTIRKGGKRPKKLNITLQSSSQAGSTKNETKRSKELKIIFKNEEGTSSIKAVKEMPSTNNLDTENAPVPLKFRLDDVGNTNQVNFFKSNESDGNLPAKLLLESENTTQTEHKLPGDNVKITIEPVLQIESVRDSTAVPSQDIKNIKHSKHDEKIQINDDDNNNRDTNIFDYPTQKIYDDIGDNVARHTSAMHLLNDFEKSLENYFKNAVGLDAPAINQKMPSIRYYLLKIAESINNDSVFQQKIDGATQTILNATDTITQTVDIQTSDAKIQTDYSDCVKCSNPAETVQTVPEFTDANDKSHIIARNTSESIKLDDCNTNRAQVQTSSVFVDDKGKAEIIARNNEKTVDCVVLGPQLNDNKCGRIITQNTMNAMEYLLTDTEFTQNVDFTNKKSLEMSDKTKIITQNTMQAMQSILVEPNFADNNDDTKIAAKDARQTGQSNLASTSKGKTVDNVNFGPREIAKDNSKPTTEGLDNSHSSSLICSVNTDASKKINRTVSFVRTKTRSSKRCRTFIDSESEDEIIPPKKKLNRFLRDDLSVEFQTETQRDSESLGMEDLLTENEKVNYDAYLDKVLETIDGKNGSSNNLPGRIDKHSTEQNSMDCDEIVARVNKNVQILSTKCETAALPNTKGDEFLSDETNRTKPENDLAPYETKKSKTQSEDVISGSESMELLPKRRNAAIPEQQHDLEKAPLESPENSLVPSRDDDKNCAAVQTHPQLDDDSLDGELENLNFTWEQEEGKKAVDKKINILENIVIKRPMETTPPCVNDDEMFSDEDIVETTPQKVNRFPKIDLSILSTSSHNLNSTEFDVNVLPPPPAFQDITMQENCTNDDVVTESNQPITIIDQKSAIAELNQASLTPENLSQFIKKDPNKTQYALINSTPLTETAVERDTIGFSPIRGDRNVIETAQSSKYTPLTNIAKETTTPVKTNLLTSTPKQKSMWNFIKLSQRSIEHKTPPRSKTKPCIACTRLTKDQVMCVSHLTNKKLATYSSSFDASVTHMIVSVDENNCVKDYTMKFVAAVAAGIWVLRFEWVQQCLASNDIVAEEPYEALDDKGLTGPKTARLTRQENPLFKEYKFFCANPFLSADKGDIEDVIKMLGGKVCANLESLKEHDGKIALIITEGRATQDFELYDKWLDLYRIVTVDIEWLSRSIGQYKLLSVRPYLWCSDDSLRDLGYPSYLTQIVPSLQ